MWVEGCELGFELIDQVESLSEGSEGRDEMRDANRGKQLDSRDRGVVASGEGQERG